MWLDKQGLPVLDLEKRSGKSKGEVREGCLKFADKVEQSPAPANGEITSLFPKGYFSRYLEGSILYLPPPTQSSPAHPRAIHCLAKNTNFPTPQQRLWVSLCSLVSEAKVGRPSHHCPEHWRLEIITPRTFQSLQASPQLEVERLKQVFFSSGFIFIAVLSLFWVFSPFPGGIGEGGKENGAIWLWDLSSQKLDFNLLHQRASNNTA